MSEIQSRCPRCNSKDTAPIRNFGKIVKGRFECFNCKRWFGPENPPDAGGTGLENKTNANSNF